TLMALLGHYGPESKAIVWAHNSHVGDARATEVAERGEHNLGQLCREAFGPACRTIGFGTDHGTVAAASGWDGPIEIKTILPGRPKSYERLFHDASRKGGDERFILNVGGELSRNLRAGLLKPRLERAI